MLPLGLPGRLPSLAFYSPLSDVYGAKGTRDLGPSDTGQDWWLVESAVAGSRLSIIGGKLTNTVADAAARAGYVTANLGAPVARIGGRFVLSAGSGGTGGCAAFVIWQTLLQQGGNIPSSSCHLTITAATWTYSWWEQGVGIHAIASGSLSPSLTHDDATIYTVDVTIVGTTATIHLPDGTTGTATDAHVASLAGPYACFEVYQGNAATDDKVKFTEVWASA